MGETRDGGWAARAAFHRGRWGLVPNRETQNETIMPPRHAAGYRFATVRNRRFGAPDAILGTGGEGHRGGVVPGRAEDTGEFPVQSVTQGHFQPLQGAIEGGADLGIGVFCPTPR